MDVSHVQELQLGMQQSGLSLALSAKLNSAYSEIS